MPLLYISVICLGYEGVDSAIEDLFQHTIHIFESTNSRLYKQIASNRMQDMKFGCIWLFIVYEMIFI